MATSRVAQFGVEVARRGGTVAVAQYGVEAAWTTATTTRIAQVGIEVADRQGGWLRVAQFGVELPYADVYHPPVPPAPTATRRTIRRLRQAPHLAEEDVAMFHSLFELDGARGTGVAGDPLATNPQWMLQWSDDGGQTWSNEYWAPVGPQGQYGARAQWRRLGRSRDRVYRVVVSDPVKIALFDAWIEVEKGRH